jgi:DNA-binding NarL/FixJ family response regulator
MSPEARVRVLIVDDHALVRQGITSVLADRDDITVVGSAEGAFEALERCAELDVDVVLMDLSMPGVDGVAATALVRQRFPHVQVVVLTGYGADVSVRAAVEAGAMACLLKTVGVDELVDAVRGVVHGRSTFSSEFLPQLLQEAADVHVGGRLTSRERDILPLLASGLTNKGIARELGLTEGTVRIYVSAILAKLGVANRTEASVVAIREHLIEPDASRRGRQNRDG